MAALSPPLVLTLKLDQATFDRMNALRQQYFPPERNFLPAHVTLFHALPGDREAVIQPQLAALCAQTPCLPLQFPTLRFLGRGVAVDLEASALVQLQRSLAKTWYEWLTRQDRQGYRPHITLQNKVAAAEARQLYTQLSHTWRPFNGVGEGLLLWHYQGGPWALVNSFPFRDALKPDQKIE